MKPIPVAFHIGPLELHTYGIGLAITFWFAYRFFDRRLSASGYRTDWLTGMFIWVVVAAVVGARVFHVLATLSYYRAHWGQVFSVWQGGLSSFGGLIFAVPTGILIARRRCPDLRVIRALDLVAPVLAASWALGRLLGPQLMVAGGGHLTHQWFGMYYATQMGRRLPVPIIQAIEDFSIFLVLVAIERRRPPTGMLVGVGMVLWGIERTVDQRLWLSYPGHLGSTLVQVAGVILAVSGLVVLARTSYSARRGRDAVRSSAFRPTPPPDGMPPALQ